nr:hypothetical protein [Tanacetum cinerariifolium]
MAEYSQKWHNGTSKTKSNETSDELAAIQAQLNNLGREIKIVNEKVYVAIPFQGWGYRATNLGFYQRNNVNPSYQERRQSMEETLSIFKSELAKRHKENSNLIKEIRASMYTAIRNQGASTKTLEIQIEQMSKVLQERGFRSLPSSTETNPRDHVKSISTIIEAYSYLIRHMGSSQYDVSTRQNRTLILIKRVYMLSLRERMELDLEARLMGETLVLNRSLDPFFEDYIELNDLNVPLELRRYQVDDLTPTIEEVLEDMDAYCEEGMGDVIFGKPFLREDEIDAKQVNEEDKMNVISHSYQKLKGFYKGVLNLGAEYVRDAKMEEWLTRWHISVHEME